MDSPAKPPPLPRRPGKRWVIWLVLLIGAPFLIVLILFLNYRISNTSAVKRLEERARAKGEPLTLQELAASQPKVSDEENGALALIEIWAKDDPAFWDAFRSRKYPLPEKANSERTQPLPLSSLENKSLAKSAALLPEDVAEAEKYLAENKDHIDEVHVALRHDKFLFPVQITNGLLANLSHLSAMRREASIFHVAALVASERKNLDAAIDALENIVQCAETLQEEVFLVGHFARGGMHQKFFDATERLLSQNTLSANHLDRLEKLVARIEMKGALRKSYLGERASMEALFDPATFSKLASEGDPSSTPAEYRRGQGFFRFIGWAQADQRLMLETIEQALGLADRTDSKAIDEMRTLFEKASTTAVHFPPKMLSAMLMPGAASMERFASIEGRRRAMLIALAVERFRLTHAGTLPDQINQLSPDLLRDVPLDPFDDQPIRYKKLAVGYVAYSVGKDSTDNGGKERPASKPSRDFDDTFIVER